MHCRLLVLLLILSLNASSQSTEKRHFKSSYWQFFNVEHHFQDSSKVYFEQNWRFDRFINSFKEEGAFQNLYRLHHMLGYSYRISPHWNLGGDIKFVNFHDHNEWFIKPYLTHSGQAKNFLFSQELALEYIAKPESDNPSIKVYDLGRLSFKFSLSRDIKLFNQTFGFGTFYRLFFIKELGNDDSVFSDRYIDKTRWRVEAYYKPSDNWKLSVFSYRETDYYANTLNSTNINNVRPRWGTEVKYTF